MLEAVTDGKIARNDVTAFQIRQLRSFGNDQINKRLRELWPELRHTTEDKARKIAEYRKKLTPENLAAANVANGRRIFQRSCAACHILFGEGRKVGPDLTGAQRSNLNYLLENDSVILRILNFRLRPKAHACNFH